MKDKFIILLKKIIDKLEGFYFNLNKDEPDKFHYSSLSPIENADEKGHYSNALGWALNTRVKNDIKNIALTGPYGSGKTSILKTFQKNYKNNDLHFLNISLATFKEEDVDIVDSNTPDPAIQNPPKSDLLRLIELSILQQIFYHEEDQNIPDSSFKKIKSIKRWESRFFSTSLFLFVLSIFYLIDSRLVIDKIQWIEKLFINDVFFYTFSTFYAISLSYLTLTFLLKKAPRTYLFKLPIIVIWANILLIGCVIIKVWDFSIFEFLSNNLIGFSGRIVLLVIAFIYSSFFIIFILYKSIRLISSLTLKKFKFQDAEIEIDKKINKSILNHHIDEILYFFEVTNYNVVIIEDLDRFRTSEVFTKLRELNLLLNNSKKTAHKHIVFIYAIRDEMFTDTDRTKFFDFIIPVIPIINSSNSGSILFEKRQKFKYDLTDNLIEQVSFYIDDMRLLHNITNEFYLYKEKLEENLIPDKLFAIITFKNIYPNDFVRLNKNKGDLCKVINLKTKYIKNKVDELDGEIVNCRSEMKTLEELSNRNIANLRKIYILKAIESLDKFHSFVINNSTINFDALAEQENFEYLINDKIYYNKYEYYSSSITQTKSPSKFINIENLVDPLENYRSKEGLISSINNGSIQTLRNKISEIEDQKNLIRNLKISKLIKSDLDNEIKELNLKSFKREFLVMLISNGFVEEDYIDYISLFHEGTISRSDYKFFISVKNKTKLEPNYKLHKIDKLLKKINVQDFNSGFILNYNIIDFLLKHVEQYPKELDAIFNKLKDESILSIAFINEYILVTENIDLFIKQLSKYWLNIFNFVINGASYNDEQKNKLFILLIEYAEIATLQKIGKQSNLKQSILKYPNFLNITTNTSHLKNLIDELNIKFNEVNFEETPFDLLKFIYENGYFELNIKMVSSIIKRFGLFDQIAFDNSNYTAIKKSECDYLIEYVESDINSYIENIFLKLETNVNEEEVNFIELLSKGNLKVELKYLIIEHTKTKISDLKVITDFDLQKKLLENNNVQPKWINLLNYFINLGDEITETMISYINVKENATELSKSKVPTAQDGKEVYNIFFKALIQRNDIANESYELILKSYPWWYNDLQVDGFPDEKIIALIDNRRLQPTSKSFDLVKSLYPELTIRLLEKEKVEFMKIIDELVIDDYDLLLILKSSSLSITQKNKLLNTCSYETVIARNENLNIIVNLILTDSDFKVSKEIQQNILLESTISISNRISLYLKDISLVETNTFLDQLKGKYSEITDLSKSPTIEKNSQNISLLENLKERNYISSFSNTEKGLKIYHKKYK